MRRRELVAGLGALAVFGSGVSYHFGAFDPGDITGRGDEGEQGEESSDQISPVVMSRIEAPGSPPGSETVPEAGKVTYVALFATWCGTCQTKMEPLGEAADAVADDEDVQFVSVTSEPVGRTVEEEDVVDWWVEYDGRWPVAHDDSLDFSMEVDARGVPYSVVIDRENRVTWSDAGYKEAAEILDRIDEAR